jgi:hypothetical protein
MRSDTSGVTASSSSGCGSPVEGKAGWGEKPGPRVGRNPRRPHGRGFTHGRGFAEPHRTDSEPARRVANTVETVSLTCSGGPSEELWKSGFGADEPSTRSGFLRRIDPRRREWLLPIVQDAALHARRRSKPDCDVTRDVVRRRASRSSRGTSSPLVHGEPRRTRHDRVTIWSLCARGHRRGSRHRRRLPRRRAVWGSTRRTGLNALRGAAEGCLRRCGVGSRTGWRGF